MCTQALLKARGHNGAAQVVSESVRWLRKFPDHPDLLCVRGKGLYGTGQLEPALKHFAEALRLDPDHVASRKMRQKLRVCTRELEPLDWRMRPLARCLGGVCGLWRAASAAYAASGALP